jgi:hypothetical protein
VKTKHEMNMNNARDLNIGSVVCVVSKSGCKSKQTVTRKSDKSIWLNGFRNSYATVQRLIDIGCIYKIEN